MEVFYFMIPFMLFIGTVLVGFFVWAVKSGQYEDLETQKYRIFFEED